MNSGDDYGYLKSLEELNELMMNYDWKKYQEYVNDKLENTCYRKGGVTLEVLDEHGEYIRVRNSNMESKWFGIRDCKVNNDILIFTFYVEKDGEYLEYFEMIKIKL